MFLVINQTKVISISYFLFNFFFLLDVRGERSLSEGLAQVELGISWDAEPWHSICIRFILHSQQNLASPVLLVNWNGQDILRTSFCSMFQSPRIPTQDSRSQQTPYSAMWTPDRANHERCPISTRIESAMNIENECRTVRLQPELTNEDFQQTITCSSSCTVVVGDNAWQRVAWT